MIVDEDTLYKFNAGPGTLSIYEYADDLGTLGDTTWAPITRQHLMQQGDNTNIVIWSWCGGCSTNDAAGIQAYAAAMHRMERTSS